MAAHSASAVSILLVYADSDGRDTVVQNSLNNTDQFTTIDLHNDNNAGTPGLAQLLNYDAVIAWSNSIPSSAAALGIVLADYVDAGGGVVLGTYGFSNPLSLIHI